MRPYQKAGTVSKIGEGNQDGVENRSLTLYSTGSLGNIFVDVSDEGRPWITNPSNISSIDIGTISTANVTLYSETETGNVSLANITLYPETETA